MQRLYELFKLTPQVDMRREFGRIAHDLSSKWHIRQGENEFELMEFEMLLNTDAELHNDPYIDNRPIQKKTGYWYLQQSGLDITFGTEQYHAAVFIRSIRNLKTGQLIMGPWRVFVNLCENGGTVFSGNLDLELIESAEPRIAELWGVPRVYLPIDRDSKDLGLRMKHTFKPYRFVRKDIEDFPEKYLAFLFLKKIVGEEVEVDDESKIYSKYLACYEKGRNTIKLEHVFNESSRMHRMAQLMGFMSKELKRDVQASRAELEPIA